MDRYAILDADGLVTNVTLWDGPVDAPVLDAAKATDEQAVAEHEEALVEWQKTQWEPPEGHVAQVLVEDSPVSTGWIYDGKEYVKPVVAIEVVRDWAAEIIAAKDLEELKKVLAAKESVQ